MFICCLLLNSENPDWPISEQQRQIVEDNFAVLQDRIKPKQRFIDELFSLKCITAQQRLDLISRNLATRNALLLDIMLRRGASHFTTFIETLRRFRQRDVADLLQHGGGQVFLARTLLFSFLLRLGLARVVDSVDTE